MEAGVYKHFNFNDFAGTNRRFMFRPEGAEILISPYVPFATVGDFRSHAEDFAEMKAPGQYDDWFIKGWVGMNGKYPNGVIHFAPNWPLEILKDPNIFNAVIGTLELFTKNGANDKTLIRGFGDIWEQPLSEAAA